MKQDRKDVCIEILHKGRIINTSVGSNIYEINYTGNNPTSLTNHTTGIIPQGFSHRPDLIADLFYNTSKDWWKVCEINNVFDVFENLNSGDRIYLP